MMKVIFECETEVGPCESEPDRPNASRSALFAYTQASLNGHKGMLKIEQHCYVRRGEELPDQPWFKPEIMLEPALDSRAAMVALAKQMHQQFVERVRKEWLHHYAA